MLYPSGIKCIVCDEELSHDTRYGVCDSCTLPRIETFCTVCGRQVPEQNLVCDQCKETVMPFAEARSVCVYTDDAMRLVHRLKYGDARYLASFLAEYMTDVYFSTDWEADIVTFVPIHKSRRRLRGYNQAELLAKEVAARIRLPYDALLHKTVKTKNMARLSRAERISLICGTFAIDVQKSVKGKTVLLIDDVLTTGATASECTRVLLASGAACVYVLTFASVELKPNNLTKSLSVGKSAKKKQKSREL